MELLGRLAQGGVVLLNEVPANLILGQVAVGRGGGCSRAIGGGSGRSCLLLVGRFFELVLLGEVTVGGHDGCCEVWNAECNGGGKTRSSAQSASSLCRRYRTNKSVKMPKEMELR